MRRVFVGTEQGLHLAAQQADGTWKRDRSLLAEYEIGSVVRTGGGHSGRLSLLIGTRQGGLFRVDPQSGEAVSVGNGVLPKGIRCIAISPSDPAIIFVGCEPAAIFKSSDAGISWTECKSVAELAKQREWQYHIPTIPSHIRQILVDRRSSQRIYAAVQIGGIIVSEDGGDSWRDIKDSLDPDVHAIVQDKLDPNILFASTGGGGPIGGEHPPPEPFGHAFYRSEDAGETWKSISSNLGRNHAVPIHQHPGNDSLLIAAAARGTPPSWRRPEGADAHLLASADRGESWQRLENGLPDPFPIMVDAIDTELTGGGRTYIGVGGEGTKVLPLEQRAGAVYYADSINGEWSRLPLEFPVVYTVTAA